MSRTIRPAAAAAIVAVAIAATLSGCQTSSQASPSPTTAVSPSPSPTTTSPEDEAAEAAKEAVATYYSLTDAAMQDPENFNAENFKKVAITTALTDLQNTYNVYVGGELHRTGDITIEALEVPSVDLAMEPPTVQVMACVDSSEVKVSNKEGETVEAQEPRRLMRLDVASYEYPNGPWLVAYTESQDGQTC